MNVRKIVSGGQTGADRAALDFALRYDFEIGGWIPQNRLAEDGRISGKYPNLRETESEQSEQRTEFNVRDSDATLILSHGELLGGSKLTMEMAAKYKKPCLHVDFARLDERQAIETAREWLASLNCEVLNVAGPRASEDARIYEKTRSLLTDLLV